MRRIISVLAVAAVMAMATMALPGTAFAQSCFDDLAKGPGPGPGKTLVSELAKSTTPEAAKFVSALQEAKQEACE
jgi:hypothetical protein